MSIEQLKADFKQFVESGAIAPPDRSPEGIWNFLANNLVPWVESLTTELEEMDEAIEEAYHETPDVLHTEYAAVFAGIITSALVIASELRTRAGNDRRLLAIISECVKLCGEGKQILDEITIPDPDPDPDAETDDPDEGAATLGSGSASERAAPVVDGGAR